MALPQWFHRISTSKEKDKDAVTPQVIELLLARMDRLEQNLNGIKLEWADTYDKVSHLYDRTRKRIQALKKAEDGSERVNGNLGDQEHTQPKSHAELMALARARGIVR